MYLEFTINFDYYLIRSPLHVKFVKLLILFSLDL